MTYEDHIFLIDLDKIKPNPYQPRREFNEERLKDLADSIKQYGVLQPLVVTRSEVERPDGSIFTEYEIIAGERRFRASKLAGLRQVPAIIRTGEQSDKEKLELAIIENLQREDLNPIEKAQAFFRLAKEFDLTHAQVAKKIGRSREYVTNTIRILNLPQPILDALQAGQITEGHTRPLLMLGDRPEEQITVFKEVLLKKLNVRDTEAISRRIAYEKVRRHSSLVEPEIIELEEKLTEKYGNRVKVDKKSNGGRVTIDFSSPDELRRILDMMNSAAAASIIEFPTNESADAASNPADLEEQKAPEPEPEKTDPDSEEGLYSISNFTV